MYFIPRDTKFYSFVVTLKPLHRYGLTLLIVTTLLCLWFIGLYSKVGATITQRRAICHQYRQQQNLHAQVQKECKQLKRSVARLHKDVQKYGSGQSVDEQFQDALSFIIQQADACNLSLSACCVQSEEQESWYTNYTLAFDCSGSCLHILQFFDTLFLSKKMIQCNQMHMSSLRGDMFNMTCALQISAILPTI